MRIELGDTAIPLVEPTGIQMDQGANPERHVGSAPRRHTYGPKVFSSPFTKTNKMLPVMGVGVTAKETMPMDKNISCNSQLTMVSDTSLVDRPVPMVTCDLRMYLGKLTNLACTSFNHASEQVPTRLCVVQGTLDEQLPTGRTVVVAGRIKGVEVGYRWEVVARPWP